MRSRDRTTGLFGVNQVMTIDPPVAVWPIEIAATSTGAKLSTILVYCVNRSMEVVEITGTPSDTAYTWKSRAIPDMFAETLAVTHPAATVSLLFTDADREICYMARGADGSWPGTAGKSKFPSYFHTSGALF